MSKRRSESDDSEYLPKQSSPSKKLRTPKTSTTRRMTDHASSDITEEKSVPVVYATPRKKTTRRSSEELGSSPSKATLEAEMILAQYSPGTKRTVKMSDLKRLKETHEERRQEALSRVAKQKELIEERRKNIFSRLAELGYSKTTIERDAYDNRTARVRWWQLVEEPQELTEEGWEKIRYDLCFILDTRKEVMNSVRARAKTSMSSSPTRPKRIPVRSSQNGQSGPSQTVNTQINDNSNSAISLEGKGE